MEVLKKKYMAITIMSLIILASLVLTTKKPFGEAVITLLVLLAVFSLIDFIVETNLFTEKQAGFAAIIMGALVIAGIGAWGTIANPGTSVDREENAGQGRAPAAAAVDETYNLGLSYFKKGDYEEAIQTLKGIENNSASYIEAQELLAAAVDLYRSGLIDTANTYVEKDDYKFAVDILNAGLLVIPEDAKLLQTIADYSLEYKNTVRTTALADAEAYSIEQDYANALITIQSTIEKVGSDAELEMLSNKYTTDYRNSVLIQSENLLQNEGYEVALQYIQESLNILPGDIELTNALENIKSYRPVYLIEDIDYLTKSNSDFGGRLIVDNDTLIDNEGNTIMGHYHFHNEMLRNWGLSDHANICFDLSNQYKTFSGTIILPEKHKHTAYSAYISVYGDDKLLYKSSPITAGYHTEDFTIDVSDVSILKIDMVNDSGLGNDWVVGYLTNAYLSKLAISINK